MQIPVTLIAGYLGAGKTTMVNHLLREANGIRIAVLVNDFGDLSIDAKLIEGQSGNVMTLAGGCICCSYGSDLMATLVSLHELPEAPEHVLIEASGVALPKSIASAIGLVATLRLSAIIVLADAGQIQRRASAPYVADTVLAQLAAADLVVLNKCDEVSAAQQAAVCDWLTQCAPKAAQLPTTNAEIPIDLLVDREAFGIDRQRRLANTQSSPAHPIEDHSMRYVAHTLHWCRPASRSQIEDVLNANLLGLVRAKGVVNCADCGWQEFQMVGNRLHIRQRERGLGSAPQHGALVLIGLREDFNRELLDTIAMRLEADWG